MADLIDRKATLDAFGVSEKTRKYGGDHSGYDTRMLYEIQNTLEDLPTMDAEPIRDGHWYIQKFGADARCSECGMSFNDAYDIENHDRYCRHCGTKMLGIGVREWT